MRRALAWAVLGIAAISAIYGFVHEHLFAQRLWTHDAVGRLVRFAAAFWIVAGVLLWRRPKWFVPVVAVFVLMYSVWWCSIYFNPLAPLAVIYLLGSCFLLGVLAAPRADGLTALLLGLALWTFAISIAVYFRVNTGPVYAIAFGIPYVLTAPRMKPAIASLRSIGNRPGDAKLWTSPAMAVLLFVLLMHWLIALKPEVSSDGLGMHLAIPTIIAYDARWAFDFREHTWALMPMGGDFAFTAAYLLGGEAAARLFNFALLVAITAMIYQSSRRWLTPSPALLVAALFASTPMVQLVTGSLMVENVWAAMILGAALSLWRGELLWAGVLFGAALSSKVGALAFVAPAIVAGLNHVRKQWRLAGAAALLFIVFGAPPYLNAWRQTGNPIYPFLNNVFKSPYFDTGPASAQDIRFRKPFTWKTPYEVTFRSTEYFEGRNGSLGFQYFLLLGSLAILIGRRAPLALLALGGGGRDPHLRQPV